jgi:hypothetical protein
MTDAELKAAIAAKGLRLSPKAMEAALAGARHLRAEMAKITDYLAKDD